MLGRKMAQFVRFAGLAVALSTVPSAAGPRQAQPPPQAGRKHPNVPDIAIWQVQSLGAMTGDRQGEIAAELLRITVKNWTTDRTITGILWEINIYDVDQQKVVEVLKPYTAHDSVHPEVTLRVPPGDLVEVPFYIQRTLHIAGNHLAQIKIKNYAYRKYNPAVDKNLGNISYLVAEEWPFKSATGPVPVDSEKH
jgi:hypothetical protein